MIDQIAKLIIYNSFMDINCEIIPKVLDFKPIFNSKYSFVNDLIHKRTDMDAGGDISCYSICPNMVCFIFIL